MSSSGPGWSDIRLFFWLSGSGFRSGWNVEWHRIL